MWRVPKRHLCIRLGILLGNTRMFWILIWLFGLNFWGWICLRNFEEGFLIRCLTFGCYVWIEGNHGAPSFWIHPRHPETLRNREPMGAPWGPWFGSCCNFGDSSWTEPRAVRLVEPLVFWPPCSILQSQKNLPNQGSKTSKLGERARWI